MEENKNLEGQSEQSGKKHNKLVSWFLGLPKWGKILLVGGVTGGVATAVVVPTVLLTREKETTISYAEAKQYVLDYFPKEQAVTKDYVITVINSMTGGSVKFSGESLEYKEIVIGMLKDDDEGYNILQYTDHPSITAETMPNNITFNLVNMNGVKQELIKAEEAGSDFGEFLCPSQEHMLTEYLKEEDNNSYSKIGTDLIIKNKVSKEGDESVGNVRFSDKGKLKRYYCTMKVSNVTTVFDIALNY